MIKLEQRRINRSVSVADKGKCVHPRIRPLGLAEAEHLLRKTPLKEVWGEEEEEEDGADLLRPRLPDCPSPESAEALAELQCLTAPLFLTDAHLLHIEKRMLEEVNRGLAKSTHSDANVKSFVTYVHRLPTGKEDGAFLALDLGGTNFRVILIELTAGSRSVQMKSSKHEVSEQLMKGPGTALFDFMADCLLAFLRDHSLLSAPTPLPVGFTFSFPTRQRSLDRADLVTWTKGYVCDGVVGRDIVQLLRDSVSRRPELSTAVRVVAVLNDTTGCLLACAYKRPECAVGIILGTGTNAAYLEETRFADMYEGDPPPGATSVVINTEWGAFGNTGSLDIIRTEYDRRLDAASVNPSKQIYEKLLSGMYLGELVRLVLVDALDRKVLFRSGRVDTAPLREPYCFQTKFLSDIESDATRAHFDQARAVLKELDMIRDDSDVAELDLRILRYVCECVSSRAAQLAGAGTASLLNKIGRRRITVGMDGSLYKFHPFIGRRMEETIKKLVCDCIQFELVLSEDGSGRGAALASATATAEEEGEPVLPVYEQLKRAQIN